MGGDVYVCVIECVWKEVARHFLPGKDVVGDFRLMEAIFKRHFIHSGEVRFIGSVLRRDYRAGTRKTAIRHQIIHVPAFFSLHHTSFPS